MFGKYLTPSALSTLLMFCIYHTVARISSSLLCCTRSLSVVLSLWRRDRNRMNSGENDDTWWYRTPSFFMTMQGVTPLLSWTSCITAMGDSGTYIVFTRHWIHVIIVSLPKWKNHCEGPSTTQEMKTFPCYRAINMEHQQRWMCWWCTTPSKHLAKGDQYWGRLYWRHINVWTSINKAMLEMSNCYYFLSNPCM